MRKQWTILVNAKNRFYECSKHIRIYSKHNVQRANFINVEIDFINAEKKKSFIVKFKLKNHSDFALTIRKHDFH